MLIKEANLENVSKIVDSWIEFIEEHDKIVISENPELEEYEKKISNMGDNYKEFLESHIKSEKGVVFIAEEDGEIVGFTLIYIKDEIPIFENKKVGFISDLYVKKEFRNRKISSKLRDKSLEWFKDKGLKFVSLAMHPDNKFAHSVYKKWGFFDYKVEMRKKI